MTWCYRSHYFTSLFIGYFQQNFFYRYNKTTIATTTLIHTYMHKHHINITDTYMHKHYINITTAHI